MPSRTPRVLCLMGPTASGKSALSIHLARRFPIEIISVDSALVYRGMDIGTAKPGPAERMSVAHHLIDILEPEEAYSAALFVKQVVPLIADIRKRARIPVLVGGTMLYFRALQRGMADMPAADPTIRAALDRDADTHGWPALHAELARVDARTAARLAPNDAQRIQRALEVYRSSGITLSAWHEQSQCVGSLEDWHNIALLPSDRSVLHTRIATRFDAILANGFIDEVASLMRRPGLSERTPSMRAVGYRQAWQYLSDQCDLISMREQALAATRQLAKRQLTWLRSTPTSQIIDCLSATADSQLIGAVSALLETAA